MDGSVVNMEEKLINTSQDDKGQDAQGHTSGALPEEPKQSDSEAKKSFSEILAEEKENFGISYRLRSLKDKDLFPMLHILKKAGIKDLKSAFVQDASGGKGIKDIGIMAALDLADILLGNLQNVENEVYGLWSDISGISVDEMKELEFGTLPLMIADTFTQAKNNSFFRVLSRLLS